MRVLSAENLHINRGERELLHGLNLEIQPGRITVIMGPNGTGKSSLLLAMAGLIPCSGRIFMRGKTLDEYSKQEIAGLIAWQGDLPPAEFGLTVAQRLQLAAGETNNTSLSQPAADMEVELLLDRNLGKLSSGERQRVELAALMLRDCPLWLLDEPTAHLDLRHQMTCLNMLKDQVRNGRAIVVVLHDIQQAMAIAHDVVLFGTMDGVQTGEATQLLSKERLQAVFQVLLQDESLLPDYGATALRSELVLTDPR
jgi:iron complex transport system ATP-binding protein